MKIFLKNIPLLMLLGLSLGSCKEDVDPIIVCGSSNPTEENAWIKSAIQEINNSEFAQQHNTVSSGTFEGNTYLFKGICCPSCNWIIIFYNCQGEVIVDPEFTIEDLEDVQVIYKHESFICG